MTIAKDIEGATKRTSTWTFLILIISICLLYQTCSLKSHVKKILDEIEYQNYQERMKPNGSQFTSTSRRNVDT